MAPIRRYLRITKYSVLECRIYLDDPSLAQSWLLNPRDPVLPRVIEAIRPLVIPKLREARERAKKKSSKKRVVKDVITEDGFEVSVFLTETSTRHSLLAKHLHFGQDAPALMKSNSSKLTSETNANPSDGDEASEAAPIRIEEDSDEDALRLGDIPLAPASPSRQRSKRQRDDREEWTDDIGDGQNDDCDDDDDDDDGDDRDYVGKSHEAAIDVDSDAGEPRRKRQMLDNLGDDKKKLKMDVSYEGFAIYGRVLCLVVKKRDATRARQKERGGQQEASGQARMENWITSTQIPVGEDLR
ncbi:hypothetical protein ESCO_000360 [Escovopsis weberi]|uniref:Uncharacterized protein n=1 Tax=Escovopsis weberi TaxID=150374 RepID=A0A0M8N4C2_ESCWE|nr:hypothetical protein ESCO_000360 [Escovopsis weberi]